MDERLGRQAAIAIGPDRLIGTLGILLAAKERGLFMSVSRKVTELQECGFRIDAPPIGRSDGGPERRGSPVPIAHSARAEPRRCGLGSARVASTSCARPWPTASTSPPYRAPLLRGMLEVLEARYAAAALACFLSGADSTVLADVGKEAIGAVVHARWRRRLQHRLPHPHTGLGRRRRPAIALCHIGPRLSKSRRAITSNLVYYGRLPWPPQYGY